MDTKRFDRLSRSLAERASRRGFVQRMGAAGGAGLVAAAGVGVTASSARAQSGDPCVLPFRARVLVGPGESAELVGELAFSVSGTGAIDEASLTTNDGDTFAVVGQATGRAVDLRVELDNGAAMALSGVGAFDALFCRGDLSGTFAGPAFGDMGVWRLGEGALNVDDANASEGDATGVEVPAETTTTTTTTPAPESVCEVTCPEGQVLDPASCTCYCAQGTACGGNCCPDGATCDAASGVCTCPPGAVQCGYTCVWDCSGSVPAQQLNYDTCQCVLICAEGQDLCGGVCVPLGADPNNCGVCGNVCPAGTTCTAGVCA